MIPGEGPEFPAARPPAPVARGRMAATFFCLAAGLVLGIVAAFGGFVAFLIVVLFGSVGLLVGRILDGQLDLAALLGRSKVR